MVTNENNSSSLTNHSCDLDFCSIRTGMQIVGGKWKSSIMFELGQLDKIRFNQLKKLIPDISQKMLTQQLRELERDGLVRREAFPEIPPRVEYSVTKLGFTVGDIYRIINQWQQKHSDTILESRKKYDERV